MLRVTDAFVLIAGAIGGALGLIVGYSTAATPILDGGTTWQVVRSLVWIIKCHLFFGSLSFVIALLAGALMNNFYLRLRGVNEATFPEITVFWIGLFIATVLFNTGMVSTELLDREILRSLLWVDTWLGARGKHLLIMYLFVEIMVPFVLGSLGLIAGIALFAGFMNLKQR
jgi:hypothetical protein